MWGIPAFFEHLQKIPNSILVQTNLKNLSRCGNSKICAKYTDSKLFKLFAKNFWSIHPDNHQWTIDFPILDPPRKLPSSESQIIDQSHSEFLIGTS
jgi:hypothetical protein